MIDLGLIGMFVATLLGALIASVLGWLDSGTPFEASKFIPSLIRGLIAAAVVFVSTYAGFVGEVTVYTIITAFLTGGGFDVLINRISGIVRPTT